MTRHQSDNEIAERARIDKLVREILEAHWERKDAELRRSTQTS